MMRFILIVESPKNLISNCEDPEEPLLGEIADILYKIAEEVEPGKATLHLNEGTYQYPGVYLEEDDPKGWKPIGGKGAYQP